MTDLAKLVRHCMWANQVWIDCLSGTTGGDAGLHSLMSHILLGERVWFQRIRGEGVDHEVWRVMSPDEMRRVQDEHVTRYAEFLRGELDRVVSYRRFTGEQSRAPVSDILMHLCTHGMYHRGQMAKLASDRGIDVPNSDLIHFCMVTDGAP